MKKKRSIHENFWRLVRIRAGESHVCQRRRRSQGKLLHFVTRDRNAQVQGMKFVHRTRNTCTHASQRTKAKESKLVRSIWWANNKTIHMIQTVVHRFRQPTRTRTHAHPHIPPNNKQRKTKMSKFKQSTRTPSFCTKATNCKHT